MTACTAQAFLENRAGHFCVGTSQQAGGVKLHHFHIAQGESTPHRHRQPIHALIARRGVVFIHGRAATGRHQHGFGTHQTKFSAAHIYKQHPGQSRTITRRDQTNSAVFLQSFNRPRQYLFHQPADNLNAGQITFMRSAVKCLAGKGFLMQRAIRVAIEKTANLVFQLMNTGHCGFA